jgi:hypothetical protein
MAAASLALSISVRMNVQFAGDCCMLLHIWHLRTPLWLVVGIHILLVHRYVHFPVVYPEIEMLVWEKIHDK